MGIKRFSYKDIPKPVRARAATEAQRRLQATLSDPVASDEQREAARQQQEVLRQWTAGTLPDVVAPSEPSEDGPESAPDSAPSDDPALSEPTNHTVTVDESIGVHED